MCDVFHQLHDNSTSFRLPVFNLESALYTSLIMLAGQTAVFRCRIDGLPTPTVEWSKGKWRKMTNDAKTRVFYDESSGEYVMEMDAIKKNDAGTYTVTIENKFGTESAPATLIVTDKEEEAQDWKAQLKKT